MDVLGSSAFVLQNEALTQNRLLHDSSALATGLRVRSAADDPSGYAIGQTIQTKVAGLQQAVGNVQTANNLLNVANGALNAVTSILQRIRSLIVESNSDVNSSSDLANIQAEINQLLLEINKISSNVQFNGLTLFDGSFDNGQFAASQFTGAQAVPNTLTNPVTGGVTSNTVVNADGLGNPGPLITLSTPSGEPGANTFVPAYITFQVIGYSNNAVDPDSGTPVGPGVYFQISAYSTAGAAFGNAPLYQDTSAIAVNSGPITDYTFAVPATWTSTEPGGNLISVNIANLTAADVGATATFVSTQPAATSPSAQPLTVNDGGGEGQTVSISIPTINTQALGLSNLSVQATQIVNYMNQVVGQSTSNSYSATAAEQSVDSALSQLGQIQAQLGAQTVALNFDQTGDSVAIVNETTAASNIRDANIGQTVTDFTKQQILVSVGTAVLSHIQVDALQVSTLLLDSISAGPTQGASAFGSATAAAGA